MYIFSKFSNMLYHARLLCGIFETSLNPIYFIVFLNRFHYLDFGLQTWVFQNSFLFFCKKRYCRQILNSFHGLFCLRKFFTPGSFLYCTWSDSKITVMGPADRSTHYRTRIFLGAILVVLLVFLILLSGRLGSISRLYPNL